MTPIVEHRDADEEQRAVREVNAGVYALDLALCREVLPALAAANAQGEQYLTDVVAARPRARPAGGGGAGRGPHEVDGVNDRVQLAAGRAPGSTPRLLEQHMRAGVTVVDPATTWVDVDVELGQDVTAAARAPSCWPARVVAAGAVVGPDTTLSRLHGRRGRARRAHPRHRRPCSAAGATVGPFAYLRPGTDLGEGGKIGTFVETKNARIGAGSKVPHLSYVGDAEIGVGSNIGAASVFVNYDGVAKHRTVVGDHVRIGSDNMLVAPLVVGDGAYTAAGSVLRNDVPPGALTHVGGSPSGWSRAGEPSAARAPPPPAPPPRRPQPRDEHPDRGPDDPPHDPRRRPGSHAMISITSTPEKRLVLVSGRAHPALAREVAEALGADVVAAPPPTTSPTARSTSASPRASAAATCSSCSPTPPPSTSG